MSFPSPCAGMWGASRRTDGPRRAVARGRRRSAVVERPEYTGSAHPPERTTPRAHLWEFPVYKKGAPKHTNNAPGGAVAVQTMLVDVAIKPDGVGCANQVQPCAG